MPHVAILDDEADLLDMVSLGLAKYGFTTTCVLNHQHFFSELLARRPDVILMDIYIGKEDGRDICKLIKEDNTFSNIPVILYSAGNVSDESIKESGADEFVSKPFVVQELAEKLLKLCKQDGIL